MQKLIPFKSGWWSIDLGEYRPHPSLFTTYSLFSYEGLPPLPETQLKGKLQWLEPLESERNEQAKLDFPFSFEECELINNLQQLVSSAQQLGLSLPDPFLQLMASPVLRDRIPSCTACFFDLPQKIVPCPGCKEGYIIRFLNDQQWCLMWYLYITPRGEHCILVSPFLLEELTDPEYADEVTEEGRRRAFESTYVCSPSFEAFLYRFQLENTLWYKISQFNGPQPLTEEEEQYLSHYTQRKDES